MIAKLVIAVSVLWIAYVCVCVYRWRIARHYGHRFEFMGPREMYEAWCLLSEIRHAKLVRALVVLALFVLVTLVVAL